MADVLRAANDLVAAGLIEDYALGGALAAIYYVEPFTTYDADIIFVAAEKVGDVRIASPQFAQQQDATAGGAPFLMATGPRLSCAT